MLYRVCLFCLFCFSVSLFGQQVPLSKKTPQKFTKHNITVTDNYTWLENMRLQEVTDWYQAQNEVTNQHLQAIKKDWSSEGKIKEYDHLSSNGLPQKKGKYFYSMYRKSSNRNASLCYRKKIGDMSVEIVNPYKVYKDENARITGYFPSKNATTIALNMNVNGSDQTEIRFADMQQLEVTQEKLTNIKSPYISWNKDVGIFYKKNANANLFARDSTFQLYYHKIGTAQKDDQLIFDTTKSKNAFGYRTFDNLLLVYEYDQDDVPKHYYKASLLSDTIVLEPFLENTDVNFNLLGYRNGRFYFSSKQYDWGDVRSFALDNRSDEKVVIPQLYGHLLKDASFYEDYIVCEYRHAGKNYMIVYDQNGGLVRKFDVPENMDFKINFYDRDSKQLYVTFHSYTIPYLNYTLNIETGKSNPFFTDYLPPKPTVFPFDYFETKITTYKSRDGEDIPITIVYKKGLSLDGNNPTLLKSYGGYGSVSGPTYDTGLLYFLEKGGVFAYAEIRGGGEKGLKWHKAGKGLNKINTFNDFIDAAEFLIAQKYTNPKKLAITGTSHGGLVVGVAMTKRPDLFKVAIPKMGAFDMAQYGKYSVGELNYREYGNPEREEEYQSLVGYSPYHNVKEEVNYPTTLIITSDNDDRVPPVHSYKFAAALQSRAAQKNPIYLQTLADSGHYGKSNYSAFVEEKANFYNFILYHLNQ